MKTTPRATTLPPTTVPTTTPYSPPLPDLNEAYCTCKPEEPSLYLDLVFVVDNSADMTGQMLGAVSFFFVKNNSKDTVDVVLTFGSCESNRIIYLLLMTWICRDDWVFFFWVLFVFFCIMNDSLERLSLTSDAPARRCYHNNYLSDDASFRD